MADSIREALTAAMDAAPADEPVTPSVTTAPEPVKSEPAKDAVSGTPAGDAKVTTKEPGKVGAPDTRPPEAAKPETVAVVGTPDPTGPQAPAAWTAEEKASWSTLPRQAQTAILRREADARKAVNMASEARKAAEEYTKVLEPFEPLIKARNVTPAQAVREVMGMSAVLLTGSKEQKASLIAQMIKTQGVDIELLDSILAGEAPANAAPAIEPPPPSWAQKLLALSNKIDETAKERSDRLKADADAAIEAAIADTVKYPHFQRVRENIADVLEMAKNRGIDMTLDQAYERAVTWDPELRDIEAQKARASTVSDAARTLAASRKAASSVAGAPVTGGAPKPATIREALVAAMDGR